MRKTLYHSYYMNQFPLKLIHIKPFMCGIFAYFSKSPITNKEQITNTALKCQHRGPDSTTCLYHDHYVLIFHRLAINGLNPESGQPMVHPQNPNVYLICNGEIYNYRDLIEEYGIDYKSKSDCEIILHLYTRIGFTETVKRLYGVFALCLVDTENGLIHMARDPYGVRSMYWTPNTEYLCLSSEYKSLYMPDANSGQFPNGTVATYSLSDLRQISLKPYYVYESRTYLSITENHNIHDICIKLRELLINAVEKRLMCDRQSQQGYPAIGAYLSGGFDSSIISALLQDLMRSRFTYHKPDGRNEPLLKTFSIGFAGSPDLQCAQIVAQWIGSSHTEVIVTEQEALDAIPEVIRQIESYDTTTVRASTFMYLLSMYIKKHHTDIVVMYSGEGSDEASGSYLYFCNAPDATSFQEETEKLLKELPYFDVLRCDKSTAVAGLEVRVPFLDLNFIKYYMSLDPELK